MFTDPAVAACPHTRQDRADHLDDGEQVEVERAADRLVGGSFDEPYQPAGPRC
jgi:hypothetical protein